MGIELRDDQLTDVLPTGAWLIGGKSASDPAPSAFSRLAISNYVSSTLAPVAASGSASDLSTGTVPLGRLHAYLADIASIQAPSLNQVIAFDGSDFVAANATDVAVGGLVAANNLSDLTSPSTARTNLQLGSMALESTSSYLTTAAIAAAYQPLDGDLTAIGALSTTSYGRSLLTLTSSTALAAEVDSFFLTPTEGNAAYQPLDSDLTAISALTTATFGRSLLTMASDIATASAIGVGTEDSPTFSGLTLTGALTGSKTLSGASSSDFNPANYLSITDTLNALGGTAFGDHAIGLAVQHTMATGVGPGNRTALLGYLVKSANAGGGTASADDFYHGVFGKLYVTSAGADDGGTIGAPYGNYYGGAFGVFSENPAGAVYWNAATGIEVDLSIPANVNVKQKIGVAVVYTNADTNQGTTYDAAFGVHADGLASHPGAKVAYGIGKPSTPWPIHPTNGTLFGVDQSGSMTGSIAAKYGVDLNGVTFTDYAIRSNGFSVGPTGGISASTILLPNSGLAIWDSDVSNVLLLAVGSNLSGNRTFTLTTGDANRTLNIAAGDVTISAYGASLVDDADAATARSTLGLVIGTNVQGYDADLTTWAGLTPSANHQTLVTQTFAQMRTSLGLVVGTDVQAQDAELAAIAGLTSAADRLAYFTGSGTAALATFTSYGRSVAALADAAALRTLGGLVIGTDVQAYNAAILGAWTTASAPTVTAGSGTYTSASATLSTRTVGKTVEFRVYVTITTNGSAAIYTQVALPFTAAGTQIVVGREMAVTGFGLQGYIASGTANLIITKYDATYAGGTGYALAVTGVVETT